MADDPSMLPTLRTVPVTVSLVFCRNASDWTQRGLSSTRFCCESHPKQNRNRNLVNSKQSRQHGCFRSTVLTQIRWRPSAGGEDIFFYFSHFVYRELLIPVNFHFMFITSEEICLASSQPLQVSNRTSSAAAYSQRVLSRPSWSNKGLQRRADRERSEPLSCGFLLCRKPRPQRAIILSSGPAGGLLLDQRCRYNEAEEVDDYGACEVWVGVWRRVWQQWSVMWRPPDTLRRLVKCLVSRVLAESSTVQLIITQNQVSTVNSRPHAWMIHIWPVRSWFSKYPIYYTVCLVGRIYFILPFSLSIFGAWLCFSRWKPTANSSCWRSGYVLLIAANVACSWDEEQLQLLCLNSESESFRGAFEGQLRHNAVRRLFQMLLLSPLFGGCTATIPRGLTYPKILCTPKKEERKRENGDNTHRRSSLSKWLGGRNRDVRVKHLVTQPGNAPKARPSHLKTADEVNEVSLKDSAFEDCKGRVLQRMQTLN